MEQIKLVFLSDTRPAFFLQDEKELKKNELELVLYYDEHNFVAEEFSKQELMNRQPWVLEKKSIMPPERCIDISIYDLSEDNA